MHHSAVRVIAFCLGLLARELWEKRVRGRPDTLCDLRVNRFGCV